MDLEGLFHTNRIGTNLVKETRIKRNDLILVAVLLTAAVISFAVVKFLPEKGSTVVVYIKGERAEIFSLGENRSFTIESDLGTNELVIEDGTAYLKEADCPDKLCVHTGKIRKEGEMIVCLPHKVIVTIENGEGTPEREDDIDAVAG